jgi:hypothetical protein
MLHLELNIQPHTAQRLKKILASAPDQETFARGLIAYQIAELRKGILNIRVDLKQFEDKYQQSTADFYRQFAQGQSDDSADALLWAGLYEMLQDNERRLQELV